MRLYLRNRNMEQSRQRRLGGRARKFERPSCSWTWIWMPLTGSKVGKYAGGRSENLKPESVAVMLHHRYRFAAWAKHGNKGFQRALTAALLQSWILSKGFPGWIEWMDRMYRPRRRAGSHLKFVGVEEGGDTKPVICVLMVQFQLNESRRQQRRNRLTVVT